MLILPMQMVEAVIRSRFSTGVGQSKVSVGEYGLFNSRDHSKLVTRSVTATLKPGLSLTMAIIYGRYDALPMDRWPNSACRSTELFRNDSGSLSW